VSPMSIWRSFGSACPVLYRYSKPTCLIFYISPHNKYFQPRYAAAAAAADDDDDDDGGGGHLFNITTAVL